MGLLAEGRETREEVALCLDVRGVVQGVGFRPFVHRLALRFGLTGWVRNEAGAVRIQVQGSADEARDFSRALREEAPPLAVIDAVESREVEAGAYEDFRVVPSAVDSGGRLPVSPDVATCGACLAELRHPSDRRYRYPFITCTDCGPRFTVIRSMPYDRERTSMGAFEQCPACAREYETPSHRRYHSETNSCPRCGPRLWLEGEGATVTTGEGEDADQGKEGTQGRGGPVADPGEAVTAAALLLARGKIVAVKGLGGFHLAADATSQKAVERLRSQKGRERKPLAVMVLNLEEARRMARVTPEEAGFLASPRRPILLLPTAPGSPLAPSVAPELDTVGLMLPYTPLHHILLEETGRPLVMTSANATDEPMVRDNDEAREKLNGVADAFLLHDREIVNRCDDSVARFMEGGPVLLRRARGYAPLPVPLPFPSTVPLLAVGPHLKNTFTLVHGRSAFVSQHVGDLETLETLRSFREAMDHARKLFRVEPQIIVRDLHPGYLSTRVALELAEAWGLGTPMAVQHHHAHVAAVAGEHGVEGPVVGVAFDGTGYGEDGAVWGGEILLADLTGFRRVGHLRYGPLPGGEAAIRLPWRTALGYACLEPGSEGLLGRAWQKVAPEEVEIVRAQTVGGVNSPLASSMGRLFDAAAAVLGVRRNTSYEGQAAMELEALARSGAKGRPDLAGGQAVLPFPFDADGEGCRVMDPLPLLKALARGVHEGRSPGEMAAAFHESVARTTAALVRDVCEEEGVGTVALGGGVFQNAFLTPRLVAILEKEGFRVLLPRALGPNDGAVSYGQAVVAAARLRKE